MNGLLYVALGGAIGASARHIAGLISLRLLGPGFPIATMSVNVLGSFLMGILAGWLALRVSGGEHIRLFLGAGLLGGFTTFSAFSLDAVNMLHKKALSPFILYVGGSVFLSLGALMVGLWIARKVFAV